MSDWTKLRTLAEAATPGPWKSDCDMFDRDEGIVACVINESLDLLVKIETGIYVPHKENYSAEDYAIRDRAWLEAEASQERKDAAFVAAANPQTVIALLDESDWLRSEKWKYEGEAAQLRDQLAAVTAALNEAVNWLMEVVEPSLEAERRITELRKVGQ